MEHGLFRQSHRVEARLETCKPCPIFDTALPMTMRINNTRLGRDGKPSHDCFHRLVIATPRTCGIVAVVTTCALAGSSSKAATRTPSSCHVWKHVISIRFCKAFEIGQQFRNPERYCGTEEITAARRTTHQALLEGYDLMQIHHCLVNICARRRIIALEVVAGCKYTASTVSRHVLVSGFPCQPVVARSFPGWYHGPTCRRRRCDVDRTTGNYVAHDLDPVTMSR